MTWLGNKERFELREAEDGQWYFVHKRANNEIVETSETYTRKSDALEAAERESGDLPVEVVESD